MKPIKKIAILGVGFMGGSLALGLKEALPKVSIWGYARKKSSYIKLRKLAILDKVEQDLKKVIEDSDVVVLALPIYAIIEYFKKISPFLKKGAIVIDLGSSKELIVKAARKYLPKGIYFVGCHPLCGSDKSGAEFSSKNLYNGSLCLITSSPANAATRNIKVLWEKLNCKVAFLSALAHDKILSSVSHLTHLISFSFTNFVPTSYLEFSATSLKDLTRISNSPAFIWADIFLSNKKNILRDTKRFIKILEDFETLIKKNDKEKIIKLIRKINNKQKLLFGLHH